jgi:cystathionine beta-lyase
MTGATGLFGVVLNGWSEEQAKAFVDGLELFGIGASWGGFESLAILAHPKTQRTATVWQAEGPLLRLHIGLEDPEDLIADLEAGFARVSAAT